MYDNTKKLFLFLTFFTIIIGLSATYATDLSDDRGVSEIQSNKTNSF